MHSPDITARIEAADLPATVYRTARRLLDLASDDGHITLSKDAMMSVCGTASWGTVRGHLTQLATAGLIHYSTNSAVYVNFTRAEHASTRADYAPARAEHATSTGITRAQRAQNAPSRAEHAPVIAEHAPTRAERSNQPSLGRLGKVGRLGTDQTTYLPTLDDLTDEQRRAVALLTDPDVGLVEASAIEHATTHTWTHILRMVANWWTDVQDGKLTGPGALHTRLQRNWTAGPITADFRRSDLCERHAPEETAARIDTTERKRYQIA